MELCSVICKSVIFCFVCRNIVSKNSLIATLSYDSILNIKCTFSTAVAQKIVYSG